MSPVESPSCADPNLLSSGPACVRYSTAWECPSSPGRAMDTREKKSPLPVYDPKVEGRPFRYSSLLGLPFYLFVARFRVALDSLVLTP
ncbi:hypothetical protein CRG98_012638 [Punica granatum]|uniref:Uncharacterized protein n=1 Tax=Punica granatum TaxID=22663 RepID=A0A2I0KFL7_PUNGR|nr:hypothetical protein CRG98_012638 [Punica granatum]